MSRASSITGWLEGLRAGDEAAAQRLWEDYFHRLVLMARARIAGRPAGPKGSDDIALSALDSFRRAAEAGRFPRLSDRDDLWQVLMMLTARKAIDAVRRERALKRHGRQVAAEGPFFETIVGDEPTPSFAAEVAEQFRILLDCLGDDELRQIAVWKLEGYTNPEIAGKIDKSLATVERKLQLIRRKWESDSADRE